MMDDKLWDCFMASPITDTIEVLQYIRWKKKLKEYEKVAKRKKYELYRNWLERKRNGLQ